MTYQKAVVVMRAQPPHIAHLALIRRALAVADKVVVVLGSSFHARTPRNPFTAAEREKMIRLCLEHEELMHVEFLPMRDYFDNSRWVTALRSAIEPLVDSPRELVLVGHEKDAMTTAYLRDFPEWNRDMVASIGMVDATSIREAMFEAKDPQVALQAFSDVLDPRVAEYLRGHLQRPEWEQLRIERALSRQEAQIWGEGPYTRFVLCADALVEWNDEVLLIRRGPGTGEGLLAMPGGHVEKDETSAEACIRELTEEVGIGLMANEMTHSLKGQIFLESPHRSQRPGRIVSMVYHFIVNSEKRPKVATISEEAAPVWVRKTDIKDLEDQFFEDHFMAIDQFFGIAG